MANKIELGRSLRNVPRSRLGGMPSKFHVRGQRAGDGAVPGRVQVQPAEGGGGGGAGESGRGPRRRAAVDGHRKFGLLGQREFC